MHPSWIYRLLARYRAEGDAGLIPRSRRPKTSPNCARDALENEIVLLRKQLSEDGLDAGAQTIHWHLARRHDTVPSVSTIMRVLRRRGCVTPQPKKRPKSSFIRFEADLPNECWQSDMTHWTLADDTHVEIVNFIDDHSRYCVASVAVPVTKATDVAEIFTTAIERHGTPASVLTDNGCIYTAKHRGGKVVMETLTEALGVTYKHSQPVSPANLREDRTLPPDPQEVPRQTTRRRLARRAPSPTRPLRRLLQPTTTPPRARPAHPHRSASTPDSKPTRAQSTPATHFRVRHDKVDTHGSLTLRYDSKLHHIGMGARHRGQRVVMLIADRDIRIVTPDGEPLRHLTLDPTRDYQPQTAGWISTMT